MIEKIKKHSEIMVESLDSDPIIPCKVIFKYVLKTSDAIRIGKEIVEGKVGFNELEKYALRNNSIKNVSGRQEMLEAILNQYILEV